MTSGAVLELPGQKRAAPELVGVKASWPELIEVAKQAGRPEQDPSVAIKL